MSGHSIVSSLTLAVDEQPADRVAALFDAHHQRLYRLARRLASSAGDVPAGSPGTWIGTLRDRPRGGLAGSRADQPASRSMAEGRGTEAAQRTHRAPKPPTQWRVRSWLGGDRQGHRLARARPAATPPTGRRRDARTGGPRHSTIASQLGISAITVRWHLSVGRRDLTRLLTSGHGATNEGV